MLGPVQAETCRVWFAVKPLSGQPRTRVDTHWQINRSVGPAIADPNRTPEARGTAHTLSGWRLFI